MLLHTLERFLIHFFSASGTILLLVHFLRWTQRRWPSKWVPQTLRGQLILSTLTIVAVAGLVESIHVAHSQPVVKSFTDFLSWLAGSLACVYALYRLRDARWD